MIPEVVPGLLVVPDPLLYIFPVNSVRPGGAAEVNEVRILNAGELGRLIGDGSIDGLQVRTNHTHGIL